MCEEDFVEFKITDYDIENEFNVNRPKQRFTKHQQIYGIWARDSDEENETNSNYSLRGSVHRKKYSEPVCFVPGGIQQTESEETREKGCKSEEEEEKDEYLSTSRKIVSSSSDELENENFEQNESQQTQIFNEENTEELTHFSRRNKFASSFTRKDVGSWEKHTKGIGTKLLLQMGFQPGKGLGRELQGIPTPVEAYQRKGRGALGAYGPEQDLNTRKICSGELKKHVQRWRCENICQRPKKVKYVSYSDREIVELGKLKTKRECYNQFGKLKIIDMTGPEQRILTGYSFTAKRPYESEVWDFRGSKVLSNFNLPELQHNIDVLTNMHREEFVSHEHKLQDLVGQKATLQKEISKLEDCLDQEERQIESLENILIILESMLQKTDESDPLTLDIAAEYLKEIQTKYYEEYVLYEIDSLVVQMIGPLFQNILKHWQPLQYPDEPLALFRQWKNILESSTSSVLSCKEMPIAYHFLLWNSWLPHVEAAIGLWDSRTCQPLINFFETWLSLIPVWMLQNIYKQMVLPRIEQSVEAWDPLTDPVPIHAWVHPWVPMLFKELEATVFPVIKQKLSIALVNWHPSDRSARLMLQPWAKVFTQADMEALLIHNILPKLQVCLQELVINPLEQHLERWQWVMDWELLLPQYSMVSLLERFFFPNWFQVLTTWMNCSPNYDDVCSWYLGWKSIFPESLLSEPAIKEQFRKVLNFLQQVTLQSQQSSTRENVLDHLKAEQMFSSQQQNQDSSSYTVVQAHAAEVINLFPQSFKDLISRHCEKQGIVFAPIANRFWDGKQVYRCGKLQIYIDRNVAFVSEKGTNWHPTSLSALMKMADK